MTTDPLAALEALKDKAKAKREEGDRPELPKWKAVNPGDSLGGRLLSGEWVSTKYGETPVITVEEPDGTVKEAWLGNAMLTSWINDEAPAIGATVLIVFDGKRPTKDPSIEYNAYTCVTDKYDYNHWLESYQKMQLKKAQFDAQNPAGGRNPYGNAEATPPVQRTQFGPDEAPF